MASLNLGEYLQYGRIRAQLTVPEVSRRIGVTDFEIMSWERNVVRKLRLENINKLVELYNLDVEIVFDLILKYQLSLIEEKLQQLQKGLE